MQMTTLFGLSFFRNSWRLSCKHRSFLFNIICLFSPPPFYSSPAVWGLSQGWSWAPSWLKQSWWSLLLDNDWSRDPGINQSMCTHFSSVQPLSHVQLFATPWNAACQASLSITNSRSLLNLMSFELVMPSNHLILCCPLLFLPSILPSIRLFSNESALHIRWPKYWSFSFSNSPSNEYSGLMSFRMESWISLPSKGLSRVFSNTTVQRHQFFCAQPSLCSNSHIHTWLVEKP